jgi:thioredoxin 1
MKRWLASFLLMSSLGFSAVLQLTEKNFNQVKNTSKPVIIDIYANWCGACKKLAPVFQTLSEKYDGQILFAKIDVDAQSKLVEQYHVDSLPTVLFFQAGSGEPSMRHVGAMNKEDFEAKITELLK